MNKGVLLFTLATFLVIQSTLGQNTTGPVVELPKICKNYFGQYLGCHLYHSIKAETPCGYFPDHSKEWCHVQVLTVVQCRQVRNKFCRSNNMSKENCRKYIKEQNKGVKVLKVCTKGKKEIKELNMEDQCSQHEAQFKLCEAEKAESEAITKAFEERRNTDPDTAWYDEGKPACKNKAGRVMECKTYHCENSKKECGYFVKYSRKWCEMHLLSKAECKRKRDEICKYYKLEPASCRSSIRKNAKHFRNCAKGEKIIKKKNMGATCSKLKIQVKNCEEDKKKSYDICNDKSYDDYGGDYPDYDYYE